MFDKKNINYGTLNETPCCGYYNHGQFSAMVEKGDVLAVFSGHDHTNAFGVRYKGIDIVNSLSTRFNSDTFSTQYGYRIIEVDERDTSCYKTKVVSWFELFGKEDFRRLAKSNPVGFKIAKEVTVKGYTERLILKLCRVTGRIVTGRKITYPHQP